jgi:hypothetical protein
MTGISYNVVPQADHSFRIELVQAGTLPYAAGGFLTPAQAQDWIARDRRMVRAPGQWLRFASRYVGEHSCQPLLPPTRASAEIFASR